MISVSGHILKRRRSLSTLFPENIIQRNNRFPKHSQRDLIFHRICAKIQMFSVFFLKEYSCKNISSPPTSSVSRF